MEKEAVMQAEETKETEAVVEEAPEAKPSKTEQDARTVAKYSDEDLDRIINRKFAEWSSKKEKELDEAKKLAQMDEKQKAEYERDALKRELSELKKRTRGQKWRALC